MALASLEDWTSDDPRWSVFRLDTTGQPVEASAARLIAWIEEQRGLNSSGELPLSGRWWDSRA